ncbi:flagellar biosynthesis protein FlhA [Photobacterium kishitanii]|uniref:Flagellar biosynthesis protein FlhA n=1 Tax=Photobacterium kishitanii TaxID=318456 RepID=A0A2T3KMY3_9GAMM|nr:flagellar biosynthesis protein FlhA [Photobacterium kishitanii]PSV01105.1 flagellar biosynthesis protein FlhA [Photobacterium kishitanii]
MSNNKMKGIQIPILAMLILGMMVVPLPPAILDILFVVNICVALTVLMAATIAKKPLDFSSFPTVLLISTIMRLGLNVASTRIILMHGHDGGDASGMVIKAFGDFAMGGNFVVGIIVFAVLFIISIMVVTKGSERVSEVVARFTLDAMPGKQMAIDADLAAGAITQEEATEKRALQAQEAQFFGSMDGASKFVKGDSIAGVLILAINIIGGIAIGSLQQGMPLSKAVSCYTVLSIGDGLVAILPSIIMALAMAVMITKINDSKDLSSTITTQLFKNYPIVRNVGMMIFAIGLIPAMPNVLFLSVGSIILCYAYQLGKKLTTEEVPRDIEDANPKAAVVENKDVSVDDVSEFDVLSLELGFGLNSLMKNSQDDLQSALNGVRKTVSNEFGIMVPGVHFKNNAELEQNKYSIVIQGVEVAHGEVYPGLSFAMDYEDNLPPLEMGKPSFDPVDGIKGYWILEDNVVEAGVMGYEVVSSTSVISNHFRTMLERNLPSLIDIDSLQLIIDKISRTKSKLVSTVITSDAHLVNLYSVIKELLDERVPVNQMGIILEAMAELQGVSGLTQDSMLRFVRGKLSKWIIKSIRDTFGMESDAELFLITLEQDLANVLMKSIISTGVLTIDSDIRARILEQVKEKCEMMDSMEMPTIILAQETIRKELFNLLNGNGHDLYVLSPDELPKKGKVKVAAQID